MPRPKCSVEQRALYYPLGKDRDSIEVIITRYRGNMVKFHPTIQGIKDAYFISFVLDPDENWADKSYFNLL